MEFQRKFPPENFKENTRRVTIFNQSPETPAQPPILYSPSALLSSSKTPHLFSEDRAKKKNI